MNVISTQIPDVLIVRPSSYSDERGHFFESYNFREYAASGIAPVFVQDNQSHSVRNVLRGLHYQVAQRQGKLVRVLAGEIFDVAVDIKKRVADLWSMGGRNAVGLKQDSALDTDRLRARFSGYVGIGRRFVQDIRLLGTSARAVHSVERSRFGNSVAARSSPGRIREGCSRRITPLDRAALTLPWLAPVFCRMKNSALADPDVDAPGAASVGPPADTACNVPRQARLRVAFVYRPHCSGAYSIETLFHSISEELRSHIDVIEYVAAGPRQLFTDAWRLRRLNCDIYHITGDINYMALLLPRDRTVLTIHDVGHLVRDLRGLRQLIYKWLWFKLPIRHAAAVTAISSETQRKLQHHVETVTSVQVVPNCVGKHFRRRKFEFNREKPRILQVGTQPHKNLDRVIEATHGLNCVLSIVGEITSRQRSRLQELRIDFDCKVGLTDAELIRCYEDADLVCFASLHEGFGLPIIEAQAVGIPVITSDLPPMNDIAANSAHLVDPYSVDSIRNGIRRVLEDESYRDALVRSGTRNAERYGVQAVAKAYLRVYERCSSDSARARHV
jgi:glycosyltransferase involved in cell wall biosynthesis